MAEGGHGPNEINQPYVEILNIYGPTNINDSLIRRALVAGDDEKTPEQSSEAKVSANTSLETLTLHDRKRKKLQLYKCDIQKGVDQKIIVKRDQFQPTNADIDVRQVQPDVIQDKIQGKVTEPERTDKDLAWLVEGKIVMYKNQPLTKMNSKVFYGRQKFLTEVWQEVAIKIIEYKEKNLRELRVLLHLHHSNIVRMFDAGEYQAGLFGYIYIVMELCAQNLRKYIGENPFNFQKLFSFSQQLIDGLAFLHQNKVVHRDLKPDNVLISFDKESVKLSDFGLSKEIPEGQSEASVTTAGAGTEGFKSPETYQPNTRVSPSVDIFPYGLVVHFIFTKGQHPYGTKPNIQSCNIMENKNRNLSLVAQLDKPNRHKRVQLLDLLKQTLQHNPRERPTAEAIKRHSFFTDVFLDDVERLKEKFDASTLGISSFESSKTNQARSIEKVQDVHVNTERTESDKISGNQWKMQVKVGKPGEHDKDLAWLVKGRIVMYKKRPLSKVTKNVFYGRQQFLPEYWREVAIKLIEYKKKNLRELRILLKLHHPNIIHMFDAGEYQTEVMDYLYLVIELCAQTLQKYVDENPFNFQKSFSFAKQLARGLAFLHKNHVIHRDLKPDNVLISFDKKSIKLSDFGLSKEILSGESAAIATANGVGTEGYRSPETYQPNVQLSTSVDIFPYGLVVHFTFTEGKHPYGTNPSEQSYNILKDQNRNLSLIPQFEKSKSHKRAQFLDLLNQTLMNNPRDRPSAEEIRSHVFFTEAILDDPKEITEIQNVSKLSPSLESSSIESSQLNQATSYEEVQQAVEDNVERTTRVFDRIKVFESLLSSSGEFEKRKRPQVFQKVEDKKADKDILQPRDEAKRIKELEKNLSEEKDFRRISLLLKELQQLRGSDDLDILLRVAECEIQLKTGKERESIQRLRDFVRSSRCHSAESLWEMAEDFYENKSYIRALILYQISNDLQETQNVSPDDAVKRIRDCVLDVEYAANPLLEAGGRSREIGTVYGLQYMKKLLEDLRVVENASPEVKTLNEAACLVHITASSNNALDFKNSIRLAQEGIAILENHFGSKSCRYESYGSLLHNLGTAYGDYGEWLVGNHRNATVISNYYSKAENCYMKAIKAYETASDYEDADEKLEDIEMTKQNLEYVRKLAAKQR